MPVQPAAGAYWRRTFALSRVVLTSFPVMAVSALVMAFTKYTAPWFLGVLFYVSAGAMIAAALSVACIAFLAMPKYKAERALGYTTWPSAEELGPEATTRS